MFNALVITANRVLYEGPAKSVFLPGTSGEFEVLDFHKPIISLLREGSIVVDWETEIPIRKGAVRMMGDELVAIVEE